MGNAVDAGVRHYEIIGPQTVLLPKLGAKRGLRLEQLGVGAVGDQDELLGRLAPREEPLPNALGDHHDSRRPIIAQFFQACSKRDGTRTTQLS